jgi:hypothetical protein
MASSVAPAAACGGGDPARATFRGIRAPVSLGLVDTRPPFFAGVLVSWVPLALARARAGGGSIGSSVGGSAAVSSCAARSAAARFRFFSFLEGAGSVAMLPARLGVGGPAA